MGWFLLVGFCWLGFVWLGFVGLRGVWCVYVVCVCVVCMVCCGVYVVCCVVCVITRLEHCSPMKSRLTESSEVTAIRAVHRGPSIRRVDKQTFTIHFTICLIFSGWARGVSLCLSRSPRRIAVFFPRTACPYRRTTMRFTIKDLRHG